VDVGGDDVEVVRVPDLAGGGVAEVVAVGAGAEPGGDHALGDHFDDELGPVGAGLRLEGAVRFAASLRALGQGRVPLEVVAEAVDAGLFVLELRREPLEPPAGAADFARVDRHVSSFLS
jgi:hypothetical protein